MLIGWLICKVKGKHRRGVRADDMPVEPGAIWYRCPRCGSTWNRKMRHAPA